MKYLGNLAAEQTVNFLFNTNDSDGAAVAPTTAGVIIVYRDGVKTDMLMSGGDSGSGSGSGSGDPSSISYTPSFDGIDGVNLVSIETALDPLFFASGHDYTVVLSGAVIDGETISAALSMFSLGNRTSDVANTDDVADAVLARDVADAEGSAAQKSLATVVLANANKSNTTDHPGYLTVYRTDGTTEHAQIPVSTNANADPIDGIGEEPA